MTLYLIPTSSDPFYDQTVDIAGTSFLFRFRYNTREETWWFSILSVGGEAIVEGIKVVPGVNLLAPYKYNPLLPDVTLIALSSGDDDSPPRLEELGADARVQLYYETP